MKNLPITFKSTANEPTSIGKSISKIRDSILSMFKKGDPVDTADSSENEVQVMRKKIAEHFPNTSECDLKNKVDPTTKDNLSEPVAPEIAAEWRKTYRSQLHKQ